MTRARKWLLGLGFAMGLLILLGIGLMRLIPSDRELAERAAAELEAALGVKVSIGALHWRLMPSLVLVIEDAVTVQPQPIRIKKLTAYPDLLALLQRRVKVDRADLEGAVVPQLSLRKLDLGKIGTVGGDASERHPDAFNADLIPLARFVFKDLTWISRRGVAVNFDGEVDFDPGWRPRQAQMRRTGFQPATDLTLARKGQDDRWETRINIGGGTAHGEVQLETRSGGRLHLAGKLQPRDIEATSALGAFNRRSIIAGKATGNTTLTANGDNVGELAQSLHTKTSFDMGRATVLQFDLDKAIRSFGKDRDGQTALNSVKGQLDTQNTPQGMVVTFTGVKASSGALTASGHARVANRQIEGEIAVDLVDGMVGVPLQISGALDSVKVSVPTSTIAGAAVGTAVLPGIGTAIGARLGGVLSKLFTPTPEPAPTKRAPDKKSP